MYRSYSGVIDLHGQVCLVTGGSRGLGKGIAVQLAYHGAKCYVTGRNLEAMLELNKEVEEQGGSGQCIPVQCDHKNDDEVKNVFERINEENDGKLDLLVNNVYSAVEYILKNTGTKFWEQQHESWDIINNVGLRNHYLCAMHASKLMVERRQGLILNISSIGGLRYLFSTAYGIGKAAKDRMAEDCAFELKNYKVAFISLWPGIVKTEIMTRDVKHGNLGGPLLSSFFDEGESPTYVGRTVAALLSESQQKLMQRTGKVVLTTDVGREYAITDENGNVPGAMFQLSYILSMSGHPWLAKFVPGFIRMPLWLARMAQAYRKS